MVRAAAVVVVVGESSKRDAASKPDGRARSAASGAVWNSDHAKPCDEGSGFTQEVVLVASDFIAETLRREV